jgi:hypothetical protein
LAIDLEHGPKTIRTLPSNSDLKLDVSFPGMSPVGTFFLVVFS